MTLSALPYTSKVIRYKGSQSYRGKEILRSFTELPCDLQQDILLKPSPVFGITIAVILIPFSFFLYTELIQSGTEHGLLIFIAVLAVILLYALLGSLGIVYFLKPKKLPYLRLNKHGIEIGPRILKKKQSVGWKEIAEIRVKTVRVGSVQLTAIDVLTDDHKNIEIPHIFHKDMDYLFKKLEHYKKTYD